MSFEEWEQKILKAVDQAPYKDRIIYRGYSVFRVCTLCNFNKFTDEEWKKHVEGKEF